MNKTKVSQTLAALVSLACLLILCHPDCLAKSDVNQSLQVKEQEALRLESAQEYAKAMNILEKVIETRSKQFNQDAFKKSCSKPGMTDLGVPDSANSRTYIQDLERLGWNCDRSREFEKGRKAFEKMYEINKDAFGDQNDRTVAALNQLAMHYERAGNYSLAETSARKCIDIQKKLTGPNDIQMVSWLGTLYHIYLDQDRDKDAEQICKERLSIAEHNYGKECPYVAGLLENYSEVLSHMGRSAEAKTFKERAIAIREKTHTKQEHKVNASVMPKGH